MGSSVFLSPRDSASAPDDITIMRLTARGIRVVRSGPQGVGSLEREVPARDGGWSKPDTAVYPAGFLADGRPSRARNGLAAGVRAE